jgi:hypothetical protein
MKVKTLTKTLRSKLINFKQLFRDYEARPELDRYENDGIDDDSEQAIIDQETRRQAELAMERQNRNANNRIARQPAAFMSDGEYSEGNIPNRQR